MAILHVADGTVQKWNGSANTVTINYTPTSNNSLVVFYGYLSFSGTTTVSQSNTGTFTSVTTIANTQYNGGAGATGAFVYYNCTGAQSITLTGNGSAANSFGQAICSEFSGLASNPVDGSAATNSGDSSTPTTGNYTPSQAGDLLIATISGDGVANWAGWTSPPTSAVGTWNKVYDDSTTVTDQCSFDYLIYSGTSAQNVSWGTLGGGSPVTAFWGATAGGLLASTAGFPIGNIIT